jgi:DNA-binding MarR family transcriptional regulator
MQLPGVYVPTPTRNRVLNDLDAAYGAALRDAVHLIDALARYLGKDAEVTVTGTQLVLLNRLLFEGNSTRLRDLAKSMHVSSHTMTQHIKRLESEGLIERAADDEDKRGVLVRISESGERVARAAHAIRRATLQTAFSDWTLCDTELVARFLGLAPELPGCTPQLDLVEQIDRTLIEMIKLHGIAEINWAEETSLRSGIRVTRAEILLLERIGDTAMRLVDLSVAIGVSSQTITRQIKELINRGLVTSSPNAADGRVCLVQLTKIGLRARKMAVAYRTADLRRNLEGWDLENLERLPTLLVSLGRALHKDELAPTPFISKS